MTFSKLKEKLEKIAKETQTLPSAHGLHLRDWPRQFKNQYTLTDNRLPVSVSVKKEISREMFMFDDVYKTLVELADKLVIKNKSVPYLLALWIRTTTDEKNMAVIADRVVPVLSSFCLSFKIALRFTLIKTISTTQKIEIYLSGAKGVYPLEKNIKAGQTIIKIGPPNHGIHGISRLIIGLFEDGLEIDKIITPEAEDPNNTLYLLAPLRDTGIIESRLKSAKKDVSVIGYIKAGLPNDVIPTFFL